MKRELTIEGMSCGHCVKAVNQALASIDRVAVETVELGRAVIETDEEGLEKAREAIEDDGFSVRAVT